MSRTLGGPLTSHIATRTHTRCTMLRLDLDDGTAIGITDHDRVLSFNLGDGAIDYDPATGILPSDVVLTAGFDADNYEVTGPISDTVTRPAILGGRFNRARARLFQVNWNSLGSGAIKIMAGNVAEARIEGGRFVLQIRSDFDRYNQTIGRVITPYCDADFHEDDARCGFPVRPAVWTATTAVTVRAEWDAKIGTTRRPTTFNGYDYECSTAGTTGASEPTWNTTLDGSTTDGTAVWKTKAANCFPAVVAVGTSALSFTVNAFAVATTDDLFNQGTVEFLTGALAGTKPVEIFDYVASSRTLTMFVPLPAAPAVGDTLLIRKGCAKIRTECMAYRNTLNNRAFPEVPGSDQVLKYAVPGSGGA